MNRKKVAALAAVAGAMAAAPSSANAAEVLYGLTEDERLVTFNSSGPAGELRDIRINNLPAGENLIGLDTRPLNDQIYAVGTGNRLYVINPATGNARQIGAGPFQPPQTSPLAAFDFNPTVDRIRLENVDDQNYRLHPDTGETASQDGPLAYAPGDPNTGQNPQVEAAGYTNSVPGATSTELFVVDSGKDVLALQSPPNAGTLNTRGALGFDATGPLGFDIATDGTAYLAARTGTDPQQRLWTVDLTSGKATPAAGESSALGSSLVGIAAAGQTSPDRTPAEVSVSLSSTQLEQRLLNDGVSFGVSCDERCTVTGTLIRNGASLGTGSETLAEAGKELVRIPLSQTARDTIRRSGTELFSVRVEVRDAAGNLFRTTREFRTRTR